jgi:hypothetical protein
MNESAKSLLALLILVCLGASVLGWTTRGINGVPNSAFWMRASGVLLVPAIALLVWADFRRDRAPDLLRKWVGKKYFEQNGFCFAILPSVDRGCFAWQVLFQNRYERACKAMVAFRRASLFDMGKGDLADVRLEIDCDGGAFGVATVPYAVPPECQGKKLRFDLIAFNRYPGGKGRMLRFRQGMRVGRRHKSEADAAVTALSILALHPHFTHSAQLRMKMPNDVSDTAVGEMQQRIIWRPGDAVPAISTQ